MSYRMIQSRKVTLLLFLFILSIPVLPSIQMNKQIRFENEYRQDLAKVEDARTSKDHQAILALFDSVEKIWPSRSTDFYANLMVKLANGAATSRESAVTRYQDAEKIAFRALEKFDSLSLDTITELLLYLQTEPKYSVGAIDLEAWAKQRRTKAIFWLRTWQRIEGGIDKNFNPNDLPQTNVLPPTQTGLPAGVSPDAIKDVRLRREYEVAIAKNNQKAEKYRSQHRLRKMKEWFPDKAERFLAHSYSSPPTKTDELRQLLTRYIGEKSTIDRIVNRIGKP